MFIDRERSSAGRSLQVAIHVTPPSADWGHCCFVSAANQFLCCYIRRCPLPYLWQPLIPGCSMLLGAGAFADFLLQPACMVDCRHHTFNLFIPFILAECLWGVNPLVLYCLFCILYSFDWVDCFIFNYFLLCCILFGTFWVHYFRFNFFVSFSVAAGWWWCWWRGWWCPSFLCAVLP